MIFRRLSVLGCLLFAGCASDLYLASDGHKFFRDRDYSRAAEAFAKEAEKPGTNQLLFMLDEAMALYAQGRYEEALPLLLKAEDVAAIKDYTSISEEIGVLATSGNVRGYTGEDFEKVLINVYLAMGYAALGKFEDAQVEARKINLILYKMINEGKRNYQESPFARYFAGLLWEASGEVNSAYIDYKKTYELDSDFPQIGEDIVGTAKKLRFLEDLREWSQKFPTAKGRAIPRDHGEIVVIFEKGLSPVKVPRGGQDSSLPRFIPRYSEDQTAEVVVDGQVVGRTETVLDIESTSTRYLEDRIGRMAAAKVAGLVAKGAIAAGVGKLSKNEDLGWIAFYVLAATDRADLRCWRTLPGALQMLRAPVPAGRHQVELRIIGGGGQVLSTRNLGSLSVKAGHKIFRVGRY